MKIWFLVILVYGSPVYSGPVAMTAEECALQAAFRIVQIEQYAASGLPVPEEFGGAGVELSDVEVKCLRRTKGG